MQIAAKDDRYYRTLSNILPRYVRLFGCFNCGEVKERVDRTGDTGSVVKWAPGFLAYPGRARIADSALVQTGQGMGMDASSAFAVWALELSPGHRVLDLCCCPGAKLLLISELLDGSGVVHGVDISKARTHVCKNLMMRHLQHQLAAGKQVPESVLICADGATFEPTGIRPGDVVFDARVAMEEQVVTAAAAAAGETTRKRLNKSSTARLAKRIRDKYMPDGKGRESECEAGEDESKEARLHEDGFYDRVLVDAECTHDGSIRHMEAVTESDVVPADDRPQQRNGSIRQMKPGAAAKFADHCNGDGIVELQRRLLTNGFRLLRAGGVLVYSTCSLTIAQNEDMVQWFLESHPNASLLPLDAQRYVQHAYEPLPPSQYDEAVEVAANQMTSLFDAGDEEQLFQLISRSDIADNPNVAQAVCERFAARPTAPEKKPAMLAGTLRFEPAHGTSGLFVAKFRKSANLKHQQQVEEVTGSTSHSEHVSSR